LRSAGFKVVTFETPAAFLAAYNPIRVGCLVLDLTMPGMSGLDLQQGLLEMGGAPPIVFLSGTGEIPDCVRAMRHGAVDFLTKPVDDTLLLTAIETAVEQERAAPHSRLQVVDIYSHLHNLTPREHEVFDNKQIAADLGTVEKTIKVHRGRVMEKMGAESLAELVRMALRIGVGAGQSQKDYN
jgi:FixJ family two-component response regulator